MTDRRISADVKGADRGDLTVIELPLKLGKIKTVVAIVLEENGAVHVAGPMNEPHLMASLLNRARTVLDDQQRSRLVQPVSGVLGRA